MDTAAGVFVGACGGCVCMRMMQRNEDMPLRKQAGRALCHGHGARSVSRDKKLRIIGGQWRGRKLGCPLVDQLRPTPNRVRETLFNWLFSVVPGAVCLDVFAGSGLLSFEALSRGARCACMLDKQTEVVRHLAYQCTQLGVVNRCTWPLGTQRIPVQSAVVMQASAPHDLPQRLQGQQFDLVFLDPPFGKGLLLPCCEVLAQSGLLKPGAYVYMESDASREWQRLSMPWSLWRSGTAARVHYAVFQYLIPGDTLL